MKRMLFILLSMSCLSHLQAQLYTISNLRISGYYHNYDCGVFLEGDPEPRFRVRWRAAGGNYGPVSIVNPDDDPCGNRQTSVSLFPASYSSTNSVLQFEIESWEEDGCGGNDTFDNNCFNDDDNWSIDIRSLTLTNGVNSVTFGLNNSNAYAITISYNLTVLPVELVDFSGEFHDKNVHLNWETATEINSFEFEIEKSADGKKFETIGIIDAAGNSERSIDYEFMDKEPLPFAYYRLKAVDLDGSFEYSKTISVMGENSDIVLEKIYPNPASHELNLKLQLPKDKELTIFVTNIMGQEVMRQTFFGHSGDFTQAIDVSNLLDGQYILSVFDGKTLITERFVIGYTRP